MKLSVKKASQQDVYQDIVRIHEDYRLTAKGKIIPEGSACRISIGKNSCYVIIRGIGELEKSIFIDERSRNKLDIRIGDDVDVALKGPLGTFGQFLWAWNSSDMAYRVASRLALISVILGIVGAILGFTAFIIH